MYLLRIPLKKHNKVNAMPLSTHGIKTLLTLLKFITSPHQFRFCELLDAEMFSD